MKAQTTIEFMIIFMVFLGMLAVGAWISSSKTRELYTHQASLETTRILDQSATKINTVYIEGHGFSTNLTLPETLLGLNYSMSFESNQLLLNFNGVTYSTALLTRNISGAFKKGVNVLRNVNGEVAIS